MKKLFPAAILTLFCASSFLIYAGLQIVITNYKAPFLSYYFNGPSFMMIYGVLPLAMGFLLLGLALGLILGSFLKSSM